jgi:hypothetical protein
VKTLHAVERELCGAYAEEARLYARALDLAEGVPVTVEKGEDGNALLAQIAGLLAQVGVLEAETSAARERWRREGGLAGPELKAHLSDVARLIRKMVARLIRKMQEHLGAALETATQKKNTLAPQLDDRPQRHVRQAYGASRLPR